MHPRAASRLFRPVVAERRTGSPQQRRGPDHRARAVIVPHYQPHFSPEDFDRDRDALRGATYGRGAFDANEALDAILQGAGWPLNAGDVATLLRDLTDLGYLRELPSGAGPHRYVWTDEPDS
jgi:hypothetical protein